MFPKINKINKNWGYELIIDNNEKYCGKILHMKTNSQFSMHFHMIKEETWYIKSGEYQFNWIDTSDASRGQKILKEGDVIKLKPGTPHQLVCIKEGDIFEVSTKHFDSDSYRIEKGDSQLK